MVNHEPQGIATKFPKGTVQLCCFSHVKGAEDTVEIKHVWYLNDKQIGYRVLKIPSQSYRTYSSREITPEQSGAWKVDIIDVKTGSVVQTLAFTVE